MPYGSHGMSGIDENGPYSNSAPEFDEDDFDLGQMLGVLIEGRWLIIGITLAAFSVGILYNFLATPIYEADGLLQVELKKSGIGTLDANALFEADTSINTEIEILVSRMVLGAVVDKLKLDISATPNYMPVIGAALARRTYVDERNAIKVDSLDVPEYLIGWPLALVAESANSYRLTSPDGDLSLNGLVGETASASYFDEPVSIFVSELRANKGDTFEIERLSRLYAIENLKGSLSIRERGYGSGILEISLEGTDPEKVSQQVNEIANVYVRKNVERKSAEAEKTLEFLDAQLPFVKQDMEAAEVAMNTYRLEKGSVDLPLETQAILEVIVSVEGERNKLRQERDKLTQSFTPAHPTVIALDKQIERQSSELAELNNQIRELPNTQQKVLRLIRDVAVNTELYTALLNTAQELRVVKAGTVGNVRVVDAAVPRYSPVKPRKLLVLLASLVLGGIIAVATAITRKALTGGVADPDVIEKRVNIPVYATIAHSKRQIRLYKDLQSNNANHAILAVDSPNDVTIESLRNLRTAMHFGMAYAVKNNCIMITGPTPAVGKSFVSVNLAAVLTSNDKKVLVIDGDMRRGHIHKYLGIEKENGLADLIGGEIEIDQALHETTIKGLTIMPAGKVPPDPSELLQHRRFAECLNELKPGFDHIVIDSPPILAVTDATIIGQLVGATMMVLKSGAHPMREIELSVKRLHQAGVKLNGLLVNDISIRSKHYGAGKFSYQYSSTD